MCIMFLDFPQKIYGLNSDIWYLWSAYVPVHRRLLRINSVDEDVHRARGTALVGSLALSQWKPLVAGRDNPAATRQKKQLAGQSLYVHRNRLAYVRSVR